MDILELIDDREQTVAESQERPFQCPEPTCSKSFNRKSDLQRHHRIHTNERPYCCTWRDCGKSFIQRSALTVHIRTHTGEKPHRCEYIGCGKCFSDSSSLARHRRIHTGKRPYLCPIDGCEKSFCRKTTLTKHARRTHQLEKTDGSDGEETEEDSPRRSAAAKMKKMGPTSAALMPRKTPVPNMLRPTSFHEPLTPQSSRNSSFSAASDAFHNSHLMHQPPTPRSPYYEDAEHHRPISPASMQFDGGLRIHCPPPMPQQLLAAANMQNSPGSMSSCSSATNNSCTNDYFFRAPSQHQYQLGPQMSPHPVSPGTVPSYPAQMTPTTQPAQTHAAAVHYTQTPQATSVMQHVPVTSHEQQSWFVHDYPQPMIPLPGQSSYYPHNDMAFVKQEHELPTPRSSFC